MAAQWNLNPEHYGPKAEAFATLLKEVGIQRFQKGVQRIISEGSLYSFPRPGELRGYITQPASGDGRSWRRDPNCRGCHGTGFRYVRDYAADDLYGTKGHLATIRCNEPGCVQDTGETEFSRLTKERAQYPENFFGEPDVLCAMRFAMKRLAEGKSFPSFDEVMDVVQHARAKHMSKPVPKPVASAVLMAGNVSNGTASWGPM